MFAPTYFAPTYFPRRYFPTGSDPVRDVVQACAAHLMDTPSLRTSFGKDYFAWVDEEAPPEEDEPLCVLAETSRTPLEQPLGLDWRADLGKFDVAVYSTSRATSRNLGRACAEAIVAAFAAGLIAVVEGELIDLDLGESTIGLLDPEKGEAGIDLWAYRQEFVYTLVVTR